MKVLLILASGYSTRYGGYPKAFARIQGKYNVQRTIDLANNLYDYIYIVVNEITYDRFINEVDGGELIKIIPGNGDAHSLLTALNKVNKLVDIDCITVTWGDAVFKDDMAFNNIVNMDIKNYNAIVLTALDENPYAYFKLNGNEIMESFFRGEKETDIGEHDQSVFLLKIPEMINILDKFCREDNDDKCEKKLLNCFSYMYKNSMGSAICHRIPCGHVMSFNTLEEYNEINRILGE